MIDAQNAVGRRSVPTSPGSLDLLRPSLSQSWIARKFEKANTIAASFRTTSCHARLDHFYDVRHCKIFTTRSVYTPVPRLLALPSLTSRVTAPRPEEEFQEFRNYLLFLRRILALKNQKNHCIIYTTIRSYISQKIILDFLHVTPPLNIVSVYV